MSAESVAGPAPSLARNRPKSMMICRSSCETFVPPKCFLSVRRAKPLDRPSGFPNFQHIDDVEIDQLSECVEACDNGSFDHKALICSPFSFYGPSLRIRLPDKGLGGILALTSDLDAVVSRLEFCDSCHNVCTMCAVPARTCDNSGETAVNSGNLILS